MSPKKIPGGADLSLSIDALKKRVLDAAVRGELTEQLPEDGTAKDLLVQIADEKKRLIAEGKIKKEKPLPEISDEEIPFEIPGNWEWVRLGDLGSFKKGPFGSSLTKSMFIPKSDTAIKVYEQKNAIQKDAELGEYYISREYFNTKMKGFEVKSGDIIVSCAGTVGETYILPQNIEQGIINQALMRIRILPSIYLRYFLLYFDYILKRVAQNNSKGTAIVNIPPFELFKKFLVPLPPLAEQRRIVKRIDEAFHQLDKLKELQDAYSSNLDALRKKVIEEGIKGNLTEHNAAEDGTAAELLKEIEAEKQELIKAGKLKKEKPLPGITDEEKPFEIPENWKWVRITDIAKCELGKTKDSCKNTGEYYDYLCSINVYDGSIDLSNVKQMKFEPDEFERFTVKKGDLLICEGGDAGRCAVWDKDFTMFYQNALHRIRYYKNINPYYYMYLMHIYKANNVLSSASTGVTIQHFTMNSLKKLCFPLPPLAEQRRIVEKIDEVLALIA